MKNKALLIIILFITYNYSFSQVKIKPSIDEFLFMGSVPQKTKNNSLSDSLLRILFYKIQPENYPKIGFLNNKGEVVIKAKYNMASDFYNNYANIIKDSIYGYINKKGEEVLLKNYEETFFYYGDTGIAKKNGKYGLINRKGDSLTDFTYRMIYNSGFDYFTAQTTSLKSHILNKKGNVVFNKDLTLNIRSNYFDSDSLLVFQEKIEGKKLEGLVNIKGEVLIKPIYNNIYFINDKEFYAVKKDNKYGFINKLGNLTIPLVYDEVKFNINEDLIPVQKKGKWGFINRKNEVVIPFVYDEAHAFLEGLAYVKKGDFYGCINKQNKVKVKFTLEKTKYPFFANKLAIFKKEGKYGFINKKGKIKIPIIYDQVFPFINGLAYVKLNGKFGYINKKGKEIIPIKYKQLWFESEGIIKFAE
ncbi:MAG: WG repeat-containing protein [Flavobacteriaceae bacterium]|nr:WG repeat-containing protein [Flavobacteriaceae bacterium]